MPRLDSTFQLQTLVSVQEAHSNYLATRGTSNNSAAVTHKWNSSSVYNTGLESFGFSIFHEIQLWSLLHVFANLRVCSSNKKFVHLFFKNKVKQHEWQDIDVSLWWPSGHIKEPCHAGIERQGPYLLRQCQFWISNSSFAQEHQEERR